MLLTRKTQVTIDRKFFIKQVYTAQFTAALDQFIQKWANK